MRAFRLPPLNSLRAFEAAARHASFSRAGDELGVTHGAVSKQIKALEEDLGRPLFSRSVRQVKLTSAGREFMAEVTPALERIAAIAGALRQAPLSVGQQVRINSRPSFALRWLIPHLPRFVRVHPEIEPQVITSTLPPARLPQSEFDIIIRGVQPRWPDYLRRHAFLRESAYPMAAPTLLEERPIHRAEDLSAHVLLQTATRERDWEDWLARARCPGLRSASELWFEHQQFTLQAAIDGMGVALGLAALAGADLATGRLAPVFPHGPRLKLAPYSYALVPNAAEGARRFAEWLEYEGAQSDRAHAGNPLRAPEAGGRG
jgi:LysR family transcriptional regulator, glycine cleavage system transcriptional activator